MNSVYIHIPFCKNICSYCDFCKVYYYKKWITPYLEMLTKEIKEEYENEIIKTLYLGGGTPSCLDTDELKHLFEIIKIFKKDAALEFTFECNIVDINPELLTILKSGGVNRLSIGIQSFNKEKLDTMSRYGLSFEKAGEIIKLCRSYGFNNINLDLIYGFKNEKFSTLKSDLKKLVKLKPEHISTYSLIIEEHTILNNLKYERLDDDKDAKMYEYICKKLKNKHYLHYEVSNFALPGFESKHNLNYWNNNYYYGFGVGASGYILGLRYDNTRSLTDYLKGITREESNIISKQEMMETELMLGLRKIKGINLQEFYEKYQVNLQNVFDIKDLLTNKELMYKDGYLKIPEDKLYIMNEILLKIL